MNFGNTTENAVLWHEYFEGWTRDNWEKLKDEDGPRTWYGRAYEFDVNCLDYIDSDEYPMEKEYYSKIMEVVKPYMGSILNERWPFEFNFTLEYDKILVELTFDYDFEDNYDALYDEFPEMWVKGTWDDIVDNVRNYLELLKEKVQKKK